MSISVRTEIARVLQPHDGADDDPRMPACRSRPDVGSEIFFGLESCVREKLVFKARPTAPSATRPKNASPPPLGSTIEPWPLRPRKIRFRPSHLYPLGESRRSFLDRSVTCRPSNWAAVSYGESCKESPVATVSGAGRAPRICSLGNFREISRCSSKTGLGSSANAQPL